MDMSKETEVKQPIQPTLRTMEVGEKVFFDIKKALHVKSSMSNIGMVTGKKFRSHVNREKGVIEVTREE